MNFQLSIKTRLVNICPYLTMVTIFMNTKSSKTNKAHIFALDLTQRLGLRRSNKHAALRNLSIYYTCKNIRKQRKNNKLNVIAQT